MASCVKNIYNKNCQNLIIGFQVTVENVGDAFLRHSVTSVTVGLLSRHCISLCYWSHYKKI